MNRDFPRQKLITGRTPDTYEWVDVRTRSAKPRVNRQGVQSRPKAHKTGKEREQARISAIKKKQRDVLLSNALMYLTVVFIVFMLFMQIGKLSEISGKRTDIDNMKKINTALLVSIENLEVEYGIESEPSVVMQKAKDILKMDVASESSRIVLRNVKKGEAQQYLTADVDVFGR